MQTTFADMYTQNDSICKNKLYIEMTGRTPEKIKINKFIKQYFFKFI